MIFSLHDEYAVESRLIERTDAMKDDALVCLHRKASRRDRRFGYRHAAYFSRLSRPRYFGISGISVSRIIEGDSKQKSERVVRRAAEDGAR